MKLSVNNKCDLQSAERAMAAVNERCKDHPDSWVRIFFDGSGFEMDMLKADLPENVKPHEVHDSKGLALGINVQANSGALDPDNWDRVKKFIDAAFKGAAKYKNKAA